MQFDSVTKQWQTIPGSVKPDTEIVTTRVPPDVTPEKTTPGPHWWSSDIVTPAVTNSPGYTVTRRVPAGAASALNGARSKLQDFGTSQPQSSYNSSTTKSTFSSEEDARASGAKTGDVVYLDGIGKVKLK